MSDKIIDQKDPISEASRELSPVANALVGVFQLKAKPNHEAKITVNRFVSEIVSWYEKLRNAMDYRDDEVVLRNAIERILKRRLLLGGDGKKTAEPLLRELLWAKYFDDKTIPETTIEQVASIIDVYLELRIRVLALHKSIPQQNIDEWIFQLISCEISKILRPNTEKEAMSNFIFHILKDRITILDDNEDTKNVQVYLAVHRAFARDDLAFLRYYMFAQVFGQLNKNTVGQIAQAFVKGQKEIENQLNYRIKEKIYVYVKRRTPIFFILEDVFNSHRERLHAFISNKEEFDKMVYQACENRYKGIRSKVTRAIIRSVIFLILTKFFIAFGIEGTYEKIVYGHVVWSSILLNIGIPPVLMILVSLFIKTPGKDNSERILNYINAVLFEENPRVSPPLQVTVKPGKNRSLKVTIFGLLWLCAFVISFGAIIYALNKFHFNIVSQGIFVFFITIVSFLAYRINRTAHSYTVDDKQSLLTPFIDFLFLPIISVGMRFTEGIAQINIFIFIFDYLIEGPFKGIFGFFEQLFVYLHTKREDLE